MAAAYRGSSLSSTVWTLIIVFGLGLTGLAAFLSHPYERQLGNWSALIIFGPFPVVLVTLLILQARLRRQDLLRVKRSFEEQGMAMERPPTQPILDHLRPQLTEVSEWLGLKRGIDGAEWLAYREDVLIFEHSYIKVQTKHSVEELNTVVAIPANAADPTGARYGVEDPLYFMRLPRRQDRAVRKEDGDDIEIGDVQFDQSWWIHGSATTAKRVLTPEVRALLERAPAGERWVVGFGWVAVAYGSALSSTELQRFIDHVYGVLRAIKPP
jgi:hypothetical protein